MKINYKPLSVESFEKLKELKSNHDDAFSEYKDCMTKYHAGDTSLEEVNKAFEAERVAWKELEEFRKASFR
ncbi:hypothetical protein ACEC37_002747 [Vibrio fluvialis]